MSVFCEYSQCRMSEAFCVKTQTLVQSSDDKLTWFEMSLRLNRKLWCGPHCPRWIDDIKRRCSVRGCDQKVLAKGLCLRHYHQQYQKQKKPDRKKIGRLIEDFLKGKAE